MYAIVDIETTGGSASDSGITEVAVILHNGISEESRFETLVHPGMPVPRHITALTGITPAMVANAPGFDEVAPIIHGLLKDRVFVAHNVNFDYSFLYHYLRVYGYDLNVRKLCTVRYARRVVPGLPSYSLGSVCRHFDIGNTARHRAMGDADATRQLLEMLMQADEGQHHLKALLQGRNPHSYLPMHVPVEMIDNLPYGPGVYYFHDRGGKVIYVGKATNLKYRVRSHFSNNAASRRKQDMLREVYSISHRPCATELMALVLESVEIRRLWPAFNRSQKIPLPNYGLYSYEDRAGRIRLTLEKRRRHLPALHAFVRPEEGYARIRHAAQRLGLPAEWIWRPEAATCGTEERNQKLQELICQLQDALPSFAVVQQGQDTLGEFVEVALIVLKGRFVGVATGNALPRNPEELKRIAEPWPDNEFIRSMLYHYAELHPHEVVPM